MYMYISDVHIHLSDHPTLPNMRNIYDADELEPQLTADEVRRRLPNLARIIDSDIRDEVNRVSRCAPSYFWTRPGSYHGHHNDHKHGLWHHTLKLSTFIDALSESRVESGAIRASDVERAHAAAIIHDQWKNGPIRDCDETDAEHAHVAAYVVREFTDLDDLIALAIEEHMGPWSEPPPSSGLSRLVHDADVLASRQLLDAPVYSPVPEELESHVSDVAVIPSED